MFGADPVWPSERQNFGCSTLRPGSAYGRKGDYDLALQDYNAALRLNANYANAFYGRGWVYEEKGEYGRSIQNFNQALRLNPNLSGALRERGIAYMDRAVSPAANTYPVNLTIRLFFRYRGERKLRLVRGMNPVRRVARSLL